MAARAKQNRTIVNVKGSQIAELGCTPRQTYVRLYQVIPQIPYKRMANFISYLRVSTGRQEISGLGIEAQRFSNRQYLAAVQGSLLEEFVETESGAKLNRPQLAKALNACRKTKSTLLIARLDRLSRSLSFVAQLLDANVEIKCADMPEANRLLLQMLAVFGEHERQMIGERTRAALQAAKSRGVVLGKYGKVLAAHNKQVAHDFAISIEPRLNEAKLAGCKSLNEIGAYLTVHGCLTPDGGKWHATSVKRLLTRLANTRGV